MELSYKARTRRNDVVEIIAYTFFLLNIAIIGYFWWHGSGHEIMHARAGWIRGLGRIAGLLAAFAIIVDFVLIARLPFMERTFGRATQTQWHKWVGYAAYLLIIAHFSLLTVGYGVIDKLGLWPQFWNFATNYQEVLKSIIAFLLLTAVVGLSIYFVRKRVKYETWYYVHLLTYLAIILAFSHQMKVGPDFLTQPLFRIYWWGLYIALFVVVVLFRFVKPVIQSLYYDLQVSKVVAENHDSYSVYIKGHNLQRLRYEHGQFVIWWFLDPKRFWQGHAFSLTSSPGDDRLRFTYKKSGDYTNELDKLKPGTWALMDGPYGRFTASASNQSKVLLIAGGIGVTPLVAMLDPMIREGRDIVLLYSCRTEADLVLRDEIKARTASGKLKVGYIITDDPNYKGMTGMLDQARIQKLVPDAKDRAAYICGPPPMMAAISKSLVALGTPQAQIHTENFSF